MQKLAALEEYGARKPGHIDAEPLQREARACPTRSRSATTRRAPRERRGQLERILFSIGVSCHAVLRELAHESPNAPGCSRRLRRRSCIHARLCALQFSAPPSALSWYGTPRSRCCRAYAVARRRRCRRGGGCGAGAAGARGRLGGSGQGGQEGREGEGQSGHRGRESSECGASILAAHARDFSRAFRRRKSRFRRPARAQRVAPGGCGAGAAAPLCRRGARRGRGCRDLQTLQQSVAKSKRNVFLFHRPRNAQFGEVRRGDIRAVPSAACG